VSAALKGRPLSPEHGAAISRAKKGIPAGPMPEEQKRKIGLSNTGKKVTGAALEAMRERAANMSPEARAQKSARIKAALTGKPLSEAHKAKIAFVQANLPPEIAARKAAKLRAAHTGRRRSPESIAKQTLRVDAEAVIAGYLAGESCNDLAARFAVSAQVIENRLKWAGVKMRSRAEALALKRDMGWNPRRKTD
jgi:hypothetical protein